MISYIKKNKWLFVLSIGMAFQLLLTFSLLGLYFYADSNIQVIKSDAKFSSINWSFSDCIWRSGEVMSTYGNFSRLKGYQDNALANLLEKLFSIASSTPSSSNGTTTSLGANIISAFKSFNISIQLSSVVICLIGFLFVLNLSIFFSLIWEYILLSKTFNFYKLALVAFFNIFGFFISYFLEQRKIGGLDEKLDWLSELKFVKNARNLRNLKHYFDISATNPANLESTILETRNLNFSPKKHINIFKRLFRSKSEEDRQILKDINLKIKKGSFNAIIGPNGSGKTTLIKSLINLNEGISGEILWNGKELSTINRTEFARQVSYIPQFLNLQNEISIVDFLEIFRYPYRQLSTNTPELDHELVMNAMQRNDCSKWQNKMIKQLSGGQKQKILLTSVLVQEAEIIVLDEPTSFLDIKNQHQFLEILKEFHRKGKTIIMILHDLQQSIDYADNLIVLKEGRIRASGHPKEIVDESLMREIFRIDCVVRKTSKKVFLDNIYAL